MGKKWRSSRSDGRAGIFFSFSTIGIASKFRLGYTSAGFHICNPDCSLTKNWKFLKTLRLASIGSPSRGSLSIALPISVSSLLLSVLVLVSASVPDPAIDPLFEPAISEPGTELELELELELGSWRFSKSGPFRPLIYILILPSPRSGIAILLAVFFCLYTDFCEASS